MDGAVAEAISGGRKYPTINRRRTEVDGASVESAGAAMEEAKCGGHKTISRWRTEMYCATCEAAEAAAENATDS